MDNAAENSSAKRINSFVQQLITDGVLNQEQLTAIIAEARRQHISFITYLIKESVINPYRLSQLLAKELSLPFVDLDTVDPLRLPAHLIEEKLLQKYQILPLWQDKEKVGLAMADPTLQLAIDDVQFHTGLIVEKILVDSEKLKCLLEKKSIKSKFERQKGYNVEWAGDSAQEDLALPYPKELNEASVRLNDESSDNEIAIIQTVYEILQSAIRRGASDVHLEPYQDHLQIRFRVDGLLYPIVTFPVCLTQRIITRLKIMSQLDIAERRIPQDGRFQIMDAHKRNVDCRINTCPTLYGEKLVIRILDSNKMLLDINKLGMNALQTSTFLEALRCPHGMIVVTGPTGSGKTITLYTALSFLNTSVLNISSVENPVEIVLPGVNQVNINHKVGLNLATVLRAFLRQDPDVIMVGEMRDQETAEIGIKAAQTGHLVLSSLHTNSAAESLIRLANMGIPSYNISSSVNLIIAQRLARRLCEHCKAKEDLPENVLLELGLSQQETESISFFSARGCEECTEGYRGRIGIFEMLPITEDIKNLILKKHDASEVALHAQMKGMQTLYGSALEKLKQGKISLLEMKRIIKD
jgi:type IV pilus assembly protein PilB